MTEDKANFFYSKTLEALHEKMARRGKTIQSLLALDRASAQDDIAVVQGFIVPDWPVSPTTIPFHLDRVYGKDTVYYDTEITAEDFHNRVANMQKALYGSFLVRDERSIVVIDSISGNDFRHKCLVAPVIVKDSVIDNLKSKVEIDLEWIDDGYSSIFGLVHIGDVPHADRRSANSFDTETWSYGKPAVESALLFKLLKEALETSETEPWHDDMPIARHISSINYRGLPWSDWYEPKIDLSKEEEPKEWIRVKQPKNRPGRNKVRKKNSR